MDQVILKKDIIFDSNDCQLYMYDISDHETDKVVDAVLKTYPVLDYVVKGNFIYVATSSAKCNEDKFDLKTAYESCIRSWNRSQPYLENEIGHGNTIIDDNVFVVLPMGTDVFELHKKTTPQFREHILNQIEYFSNQRNEDLFDKLFEQLYTKLNVTKERQNG